MNIRNPNKVDTEYACKGAQSSNRKAVGPHSESHTSRQQHKDSQHEQAVPFSGNFLRRG